MINIKCKNKKLIRFLTVLILLGGFFLIKREVFAWTEPTAAPPGGNVAAPINISATAQVKIGPLTLGKDAIDYGKLRLVPLAMGGIKPADCSEGELIYEQSVGFFYCNDSDVWLPMASGMSFMLLDDTQTGWGYLQGVAAKEYTLKAVGYNNNPVGGLSYYAGIEGVAGFDDPLSYGIYGTDAGNVSAYAGYFKGNVSVLKTAGGGETKLEVGEADPAKNVSLCLNGVCQTSWPLGGGSFWTQDDYNTYLTKIDKNLALGSSDQNKTSFYVNVANNMDDPVTGSSYVKTLIGQPEDLLQPETGVAPSFFCGDGVCRDVAPVENNTNCSVDCPPAFLSAPIIQKLSRACGILYTADEKNNATFYYATDAYYTSHNNAFDEAFKNGQFNHYPDPTSTLNGGTITSLVGGTTYHIQIKTWDINGNVFYSPGYICVPNP